MDAATIADAQRARDLGEEERREAALERMTAGVREDILAALLTMLTPMREPVPSVDERKQLVGIPPAALAIQIVVDLCDEDEHPVMVALHALLRQPAARQLLEAVATVHADAVAKKVAQARMIYMRDQARMDLAEQMSWRAAA